MDAEEKRHCFELLDEYAKTKHNCFVSEFFPSRDDGTYLVCFRALGRSPSDPNRYACEYVEFDPVALTAICSSTSLTVATTERLDKALSRLTH
jgi:hypothetical protein